MGPHLSKKQVIAAVIQQGEKFLLGKRSPHKLSAPGYWCPVSGGIEAGETQAEAVVREVYEEVGLKVRTLRKIGEFPTHDETALIHWWTVEVLEGVPYLKNNEHTDFGWFTPTEMWSLDKVFLEDIALVETLLKKISN